MKWCVTSQLIREIIVYSHDVFDNERQACPVKKLKSKRRIWIAAHKNRPSINTLLIQVRFSTTRSTTTGVLLLEPPSPEGS